MKNIDKSTWSDGPWKQEPDEVKWIDKDTGYECEIIRHEKYGAFCGYVRIPENHPFFSMNVNDNPVQNLEVHCGVSFLGSFYQNKAHEGRWIGFDCLHGGDITPCPLSLNLTYGKYRDIEYVTNEIKSLARQLKDVEGDKPDEE